MMSCKSSFPVAGCLLFVVLAMLSGGSIQAALVPGSAFHLDAADSASFSINGGGQFGLVSQWNDLGTSATNLSQANVDNMPSRVAGVSPSGLPSVVYGSEGPFDTLGNALQQPWSGAQHTVFVVWNPPLLEQAAMTPNGSEMLAFENAGGGSGRRTVKLSPPVSEGGHAQVPTIIAYAPTGVVDNGNYTNNEWMVLTLIMQNGTNQSLNRIIGPDHVAHDVVGTMGLGNPTGDQMHIGWPNATYARGSVAEVLIYNTVLAAEDIAANEAFLFEKWLTSAPSHPGDFDSDGDVDGADFVAWQTHFPTASGATLADGDADADGDVDGADFVVWQTNFPFTPGPGVGPVPEPASASLAVVALIGLGLFRFAKPLR